MFMPKIMEDKAKTADNEKKPKSKSIAKAKPKPKVVDTRRRKVVSVEKAGRSLWAEILRATEDINCKNRSKVVKFLIILAQNGGNKAQAALKAGLGNVNEREGVTSQEEFHVAATQADRLMKNVKVKKAYKLLCNSNDLAEIVRMMGNKDQLVVLLMEQAMLHFNIPNGVLKSNFELIAKLRGYFTESDPDEADRMIRNIRVILPRTSRRNLVELQKLQAQGHFEGRTLGNIVDGEIVEDDKEDIK